jgi:hypothetical protein
LTIACGLLWWKVMERVMGIEYIAGVQLLSANQKVASKVERCV